MTYKETLLFVAKCLTINHEDHNNILVKKGINKNTIIAKYAQYKKTLIVVFRF